MIRYLLVPFLLLHSPSGAPFYVRTVEILAITLPQPSRSGPGIGANILVHDTWFSVQEQPGQIVGMAYNVVIDE